MNDLLQQVDVKRVWNVRKSLLQVDYEDEAATSLKSMLLTCYLCHTYHNCEEVTAPHLTSLC